MDKTQLDTILSYRNEDIISRFTDLFNVSDEEAEDIFTETKKFLYLCQLPGIFIPDELLIVDEMWHNFILFTKEYHRFCDAYLHRYFHHLPASKKEKEEQRKSDLANPEQSKEEFMKKLQVVISATYDHLGEDTVIKWFRTYPQQYSKDAIRTLRK